MSVVSRLNHQTSLLSRLNQQLRGASRFDVAVAFARGSGVRHLLKLGLPSRARFVIGLGFAITEPAAVEASADKAEVRVVFDEPETFHPKLYLITRPGALIVLSGSGNLTGGGLETNIEQYEELRLPTAAGRRAQHARLGALWELGEPFQASSVAWKHYRIKQQEIANRRAELQRASTRVTAAVARRSRSARPQSGSGRRAGAMTPRRRAEIAARRGGRLTTAELHALLTARDGAKRVAVTGRLQGVTQPTWLSLLERAYPKVNIVNYTDVRDLDALIVGTASASRLGLSTKRLNARADKANWVFFADADQLPRLRRTGGK